MDVNVTSWGEVEITAETTVTIDLDDILNEASVEKLIDALDYNGTGWIGTIVEKQGADSILGEIDEDDIRRYVKDNGIIVEEEAKLDDFTIDELVDELSVRNDGNVFFVDADVAKAFAVVADFLGSMNHSEALNLNGKRFVQV